MASNNSPPAKAPPVCPPVLNAQGKPAHTSFSGFITQKDIDEHGSYAAAREAFRRAKEKTNAS